MTDRDDTVEKIQKIATEAVGHARGGNPNLKSSIEDSLAEAESAISKWPAPSGSLLPPN